MSILICKPADIELPEILIEKMKNERADLYGIAVAKNGKIYIRKNFKQFDSLLKLYEQNKTHSCLIDIAKEPYTEKNTKGFCGPYRIDQDLVMAQTGRIWDMKASLNKPEYCHAINLLILLKGFCNKSAASSDYFKFLVEKVLPTSSRFVIMNNDGKFNFFNPVMDWWECGGKGIRTSENISLFKYNSTPSYVIPPKDKCEKCGQPFVGYGNGHMYNGKKHCYPCYDLAIKEKKADLDQVFPRKINKIVPFTYNTRERGVFLKGLLEDSEIASIEIGDMI